MSVLPESGGRVDKVHVQNNQKVTAGDLLFTLDSSVERATVETERRRIKEVEAELVLAAAELAASEGLIAKAKAAYDQFVNEFERKRALRARNSDVVTQQTIDTLRNKVASQLGALQTELAGKEVVQARITTQLPAQKASAQAASWTSRVRSSSALRTASAAIRGAPMRRATALATVPSSTGPDLFGTVPGLKASSTTCLSSGRAGKPVPPAIRTSSMPGGMRKGMFG